MSLPLEHNQMITKHLAFIVALLTLSQAWGRNASYVDEIKQCQSWHDHLRLVKTTGKGLPDLAAAYDSLLKLKPHDPFFLCGYAVAVREWHYLAMHHIIERPVGWQSENLAKLRIEDAMKIATTKAYPFTTMIWHEQSFESMRQDEPTSKHMITVTVDGKPRQMQMWDFSGPDKIKQKRIEVLYERAKKLEPNYFEVLYLRSKRADRPEQRFELLKQSWNSGGKEVFGLIFLDEIIAVARKSGHSDEAVQFSAMIQKQLADDPTGVTARLYHERHRGP